MSFTVLAAGAAATAGFSATAALAGLSFAGLSFAGLSAEAGLASSSAMMRRIDARISSIEGSWTFAGCVISDSTSKLSYTKPHEIRRFRMKRPEFFIARVRTCPQISGHRCVARGPFALTATNPQRWTQKPLRIVLLPMATVCQGNNRLQASALRSFAASS
jgi:hypothetical protein